MNKDDFIFDIIEHKEITLNEIISELSKIMGKGESVTYHTPFGSITFNV